MEQPQRIRLRLPEQDLHHLSVGNANPRKMQEWVDALPMINVSESSRLLYQLVQEINRLRSDGKTRFLLLESMRPAVLHIEQQLGKHYLGQSVVLSEKARKVASLARALLDHLVTGYKLVAVETIHKVHDKELGRIATTAIHRAITTIGETLVRDYQLYLPTPRLQWLELHQLFLMAEGSGIALIEIEDKSFRHINSSTVLDAYARTLLLSTSRPNQLRQQEIALVWAATEEWCGLVVIKDTRENSDIFAFDLQTDAPPTYRKPASQHTAQTLRAIDAKNLSAHLKQAADSGQLPEKNAEFTFPRGFNRELAMHLSQAWGNLTERAFARLAASGTIDICAGLGATHHFVSDGADFEAELRGNRLKILHGHEENPFLNGRAGKSRGHVEIADIWSQAFDGGKARMADEGIAFNQMATDNMHNLVDEHTRQQQPKHKFDNYTCTIVNSSSGGYCIEWSGEMPGHVRTGELIGLREDGADKWSIGVIRWIKQLAGKGAQLGVELLAPRAMPCAARVVIQTSGEMTEWMRTLLLPELRAIGQEATLVTPNIGFNVGHKVLINLRGVEKRVALRQQMNATAGFRQFSFRDLDAPADSAPTGGTPPGPAAAEDFDSIWSSL